MEQLRSLSDKIDQLLKRQTSLQTENTRLKETVAQQQETIALLNAKLAGLEDQVMGSRIGSTVMSSEEKEKLKKQLDTVIREIDKILSTLHD